MMTALTLIAIYIVLCVIVDGRIGMLLMLPWIALDCIASVCIGEGKRATLSAKAWDCREHPWWGWTHRMIDAIFFLQPNHCRVQYDRERKHGGVWGAYAATWKGATWC